MSYSSVSDVRDALAPISQQAQNVSASSLTDPQIQDAIDEADSRIDSYISAYYTTPVVVTPPAGLRYMSRDIAAYLATLTWRKSKDLSDSDPVVRRFNAAMQLLNAIASGKAKLPIPIQGGSDATGEAGVPQQPQGLCLTDGLDLRPPRVNWPFWNEVEI